MPEKVYSLFFHPGEVVEIRALGVSGGKHKDWDGYVGAAATVAGYFDNAQDFAAAARALDAHKPGGVYFTLNPVIPALLARSVNRLCAVPNPLKATTSDHNISCIRWLPIDIDPLLPAPGGRWVPRTGISSDKDELQRAADAARRVAEWMEGEAGFPRGIRACSGNGYHLLYRLPDLPNTDEHKSFVRDSLHAIAKHCDIEGMDVDLSVFNPARIWKVYGTTARKGDHTEARPHRVACLAKTSPETLADVPCLGAEKA